MELKAKIGRIEDSSDWCDAIRAISRAYLKEYETYPSTRQLSAFSNFEVAESFKDLKDIDFDDGPHEENKQTVDLIKRIVMYSGKGPLRAAYEKALEIFVEANPRFVQDYNAIKSEQQAAAETQSYRPPGRP